MDAFPDPGPIAPELTTAPEEPSQLPPRVLYGYARVGRGEADRAATLKADLMAFCRTYGYMLGTVFTDWGIADQDIARPGFSSLLDVCQLVGSYGVVVPSQAHLSSHAETRAVLQRQIQRTGTTLIAADEFVASLHGAATTEDGPQQTNAAEPQTVDDNRADGALAEGDVSC